MLVMRLVELKGRNGLHLRPAASFAMAARKFRSDVRVISEKHSADGKSVLALLMLAAGRASGLMIEAEGEDAEQAVVELADLIEGKRRVSPGRVG